MRKNLFFGIGFLLLGLAAWIVYIMYAPHRNASGEQAVASMSAMSFYNEFNTNEDLANKKWVGKVVEITGVISTLGENEKYFSINLQASETGGINCSMQKKDLISVTKPRPGDTIIIKGKCTGFLSDVNLVDCVIVK